MPNGKLKIPVSIFLAMLGAGVLFGVFCFVQMLPKVGTDPSTEILTMPFNAFASGIMAFAVYGLCSFVFSLLCILNMWAEKLHESIRGG
jgi:hypothetical protein